MTTRIHIAFAAILAALTLCLPAAWANPPAPGAAGKSATARTASAKTTAAKSPKMRTLIFGDGSELEGSVVGPDGETIGGRIDLLHSNLIRVRTDFLAEIHKSAEDL